MSPDTIRAIRDYTAGVLADRRAYYEDSLDDAAADYRRRIQASQKSQRYRARKKDRDESASR